MRCPRCGSETSDMRPACESCGVPLFGDIQGMRQGQPPGDTGQGAGAQPPGYWQEQPGAGTAQQPAPEQPAYPPLYDPGAGAPSQPTWQEPPSAAGAPPPAGQYGGGRGAGGPQVPGGYQASGGPGYVAPGDASFRPPTPPELPRPVASGEPIYLKPWPYMIALLLVGLMVAGVFLTQKASNKNYADLVVGSRPTLLDFFTDT